MQDLEVLRRFLSLSTSQTSGVFAAFGVTPGDIMRGAGPRRFLYRRGWRKNRVLLVAHADTVWDFSYFLPEPRNPGLIERDGVFRSSSPDCGLGADDRAGCALVWLLQELGHSILITSGEERGQQASQWIMTDVRNQDIAEEIQREHQFVVELDRRNGRDFTCYNVGTKQFRRYVGKMTGFTEPGDVLTSDIAVLCRDVVGVNLSVGYYLPHTPKEYLDTLQWLHTLVVCRSWLSQEGLPRFSRLH